MLLVTAQLGMSYGMAHNKPPPGWHFAFRCVDSGVCPSLKCKGRLPMSDLNGCREYSDHPGGCYI
jgi:hypothetical protein